jgi:hypothetical protein
MADEAIDLKAANLRLIAKRQAGGIAMQPTGPHPPHPEKPEATMMNLLALNEKQLGSPGPYGPLGLSCERCHREIAAGGIGSGGPPGVVLCEPCVAHLAAVDFWRRAKRIVSLMADAGVWPEHADGMLSDFQRPAQHDLTTLFFESQAGGKARGLLVTGTPGTGKTRYGAAAVRLWLLAGATAQIILARDLFRQIWSTYRDDSKRSEEAVIHDFTSVDLLVIDDLHREGRATEAVGSALHEILSTRLGFFRPTIITTNLTRDEIGARYGDSLSSRMGALIPVVIDGKDRRRPA